MAELTYTRVRDYYIPNLILDEEPEQVFYGKYGSFRRDYLQEHKPKLWMILVNSDKLSDYLKCVEQMAERRVDTLLPQLMKDNGVTKELKTNAQIARVGLVNNCRARTDKSILAELVNV